MSDMTSLDYMSMVEETAVKTEICEYRDAHGALVACLLRDNMRDGVSLVYNFFDPDMPTRSLGSLYHSRPNHRGRQIVAAACLSRLSDRRLLKMSYKKRFKPLQILGSEGWEDYK
jgi:arginyl-tRNA--protein-N-Asp/Glu arginylyltransferase